MAYCGTCGTPMGDGNFCAQCGAPREEFRMPAVAGPAGAPPEPVFTPFGIVSSRVRRKKALLPVGVIAAVLLAAFLLFGARTVNVPCDWCGQAPSVVYKTSSGREAYVCKDCSKVCMLCGGKATHHYENLLGTMTFLCDDCCRQLRQ